MPPTQAHPTHAVIIPHYNDHIRLERCLAALVNQDTADTEVLVVDNGSTEPLDLLAARYPAVRFVTETRKGAAHARNRGVRECGADHVIFLDADCIPAPGWLAAAKAAGGRADIVGGAVDVFDETPPPRSGAEAFETVFAFNYKNYIERKGFSVTANLATRRAVFEAVGDFIDGVSEDTEWCHRARAKGHRLILDETMRVRHPTRSDWPSLRHKWRRITREMYAHHKARHPGWRGSIRWLMRALTMLLSIPAHMPKILLSPRLSGPGERMRGVATLIRLRLLRSLWMFSQVLGRPV